MTRASTDKNELERSALVQSPVFQRIMENGRRQLDEGKGIPHDEFWRRVEEKHKRRNRNNKNGTK